MRRNINEATALSLTFVAVALSQPITSLAASETARASLTVQNLELGHVLPAAESPSRCSRR